MILTDRHSVHLVSESLTAMLPRGDGTVSACWDACNPLMLMRRKSYRASSQVFRESSRHRPAIYINLLVIMVRQRKSIRLNVRKACKRRCNYAQQYQSAKVKDA